LRKEFLICDEQSLSEAATYIAEFVQPGSFVLLYGQLGAGKTTLVKHLLSAMGSEDHVTSPTFSIANWYIIPDMNGDRNVCHIDLYRLEDTDEMIHAGIEEIFYSDAIKLVEWPDVGESIIPADAAVCRVQITQNDDKCRKIIIL
jgi:tRNA threonylcarbamoyladenosine biosynthesis protein TsaE